MAVKDSSQSKRWLIVSLVAGGAALVAAAAFLSSGPRTEVRKAKPQEIVSIQLPPLPPPPPPPPRPEPPPPPEEKKMIEQAPVVEESPPDEPATPDEPADLGTGLTGDGPNGFGLKQGGGAGGNGSGRGRGGRKSGRFDRQTVGIQNTLLGALKRNEKTRRAVFSGQIKVWADESGRVNRVQLEGSTGDPTADEALRRDLLGIQFPDVAGVPMPAHIRVNGRRPSPP